MTAILLVDDHEMLREMLADRINKSMEFDDIYRASTAKQVLSGIQKTDIDIIILDISLGEDNGLNILPKIKKIKPSIKVIMLSMHEHKVYITNAKNQGADGYILKDSSFKFLKKAIERVMNGQTYFQFKKNEEGYSVERDIWKTKTQVLSNKETLVVQLLAEGFSSKDIASKLDLSTNTVNTYIKRAKEKLNAESKDEMIHIINTSKL